MNNVTSTETSGRDQGARTVAALGRARRTQLGGMIIESLVGLLILSVLGSGIMHATARMANTQQQQAVNNIAVNQMRTMLMSRANANGADLCTGSHSVTMPGETTAATLAIRGCGNVPFQISNVRLDGSPNALPVTTVNSLRPVVLESGSGDKVIRIGGTGVQSAQ